MTESSCSRAPLLPEIFALHGKWQGAREALIFGEQRLSWTEFCIANHTFANGLLSAGINSGERVAIVMSNGALMVQAIFGVMAAGAVSVPVNLSVSDDALVNILVDSAVTAVIVSQDQRARFESIEDSLPTSLALRITTGESIGSWRSFESLCVGQSSELPQLPLTSNSELNIIYSSGTTGMPKGIVHTHGGRRDWAYDLSIALRYNCSARTLLSLGLYSNISWVAMLCTLLGGGTLVVHEGFDTQDFLRTVTREKITHTAMVPVQFQRIVELLAGDNGLEHWDISSMKSMMSCGSPLHEGLKKEVFELFPCGVIELYGLTEGIITTLEPEEADGRWASVGKPLIGTDICIVGDDNQVLPWGESGEIVSRGRITMVGYLNRKDANQEAEFIDANGLQWLRSGDIGVIDSQGYLYIVDRKKDMILSGGQNIYPQDIESVLVEHPAITEVAVIGLASKRWSETPVALVVAVSGSDLVARDIVAWANNSLGKQQRLADVIFVQELPRNANGKVLKRELREHHKDRMYD